MQILLRRWLFFSQRVSKCSKDPSEELKVIYAFLKEKQLKTNIKTVLLTDFSQKKMFGFPDDGAMVNGLCSDLQHLFLSVGWE